MPQQLTSKLQKAGMWHLRSVMGITKCGKITNNLVRTDHQIHKYQLTTTEMVWSYRKRKTDGVGEIN